MNNIDRINNAFNDIVFPTINSPGLIIIAMTVFAVLILTSIFLNNR